jgi:mannose-1-phosphate guanylyltransferase/phosphomannomutase
MVPIVNQPVMEHILGLVKHHGMVDAVATLAFMPRFIEDYFGDGEEWGMNISYALEETPLGTAGSVKNAEALIGDETFLVISGDALTDIDLSAVVAFHKERDAAVTIALKSMPDPLEFGVVITDENGRIERFLEKPSWGQVFSDQINTGIYVIEPEVLAHIPTDRPFDFSSELFPLLMEAGYGLYGCPCEGYWCDVGSAESYVQAHRDLLDGKAKLFLPGVEARDGLWVGEGAQVSPDVEIGRGVVIGRNVTVRSGAHLGDYTVLGDNSVVGNDAHVSHSILWSDSFVGKQATVNGAVLCRGVDVRARASVGMGAVIGDEVMVGHGAQVGADVQIYPYKRVEPVAVLNESLIWESTGVRSLFGEDGISGIVGVDISPELALRAAQAFGTILPKGSHVIVSRDSSRASRMVKRAMVAGLNSAGCNVRDLRVASPAINRFTTRDTRCVGGVHVCQSSTDAQTLEIHFFDKTGLDIAPWEQKKIERLYFRGEFRRAFFSEVGDIIYPPRAIEYYAAGLQYSLSKQAYDDRPLKVVADLANGVASVVLPQVVSDWHVNLITLNPFLDAERTTTVSGLPIDDADLHNSVSLFHADLGVRFDSSGERLVLMTPNGRILDGDTALHVMVDLWCRTDVKGLPIAVPLSASRVVEKIAATTGHVVHRPGRSGRSLAALALAGDIGFAGGRSGGYLFADFLAGYDGVMSLGSISRMLATDGRTLDAIVDSLPPYHLQQLDVFCPAGRKGVVMRAITEATVGMTVDMTEGVRVEDEGGWALVLPHSSEPVVTVFAEGDSASHLESISKKWSEFVECAIRED